MNWKLRHQGSDKPVENLTASQIVEGVLAGQWEPTDEVMGPADAAWISLEDHPQFAELVLDLEAPAASRSEDETKLDMTALIDVTLVLLIFFILVSSYQALERILEMPGSRAENPGQIREVPAEEVEQFMIQVKVRQQNGQPAYWIEDKQVLEADLVSELLRYVRTSRKNEVLLDAAGVDYGTVVRVIDAAGGAKIQKVHFQTSQEKAASN